MIFRLMPLRKEPHKHQTYVLEAGKEVNLYDLRVHELSQLHELYVYSLKRM